MPCTIRGSAASNQTIILFSCSGSFVSAGSLSIYGINGAGQRVITGTVAIEFFEEGFECRLQASFSAVSAISVAGFELVCGEGCEPGNQQLDYDGCNLSAVSESLISTVTHTINAPSSGHHQIWINSAYRNTHWLFQANLGINPLVHPPAGVHSSLWVKFDLTCSAGAANEFTFDFSIYRFTNLLQYVKGGTRITGFWQAQYPAGTPIDFQNGMERDLLFKLITAYSVQNIVFSVTGTMDFYLSGSRPVFLRAGLAQAEIYNVCPAVTA